MHTNKYRQLHFEDILGYPNLVPDNARKHVPKFTSNNALSGEDHLKAFQNFIEDCEIWDEDVAMKYFMQSLIEDARDWYRSLLDASIDSKDSFFRAFREQYGDQIDP